MQGVCEHCHDHIQVDFGEDRRWQGLKKGKTDRLDDPVSDTPPPRIAADLQFRRQLKVFVLKMEIVNNSLFQPEQFYGIDACNTGFFMVI